MVNLTVLQTQASLLPQPRKYITLTPSLQGVSPTLGALMLLFPVAKHGQSVSVVKFESTIFQRGGGGDVLVHHLPSRFYLPLAFITKPKEQAQ